MGKIIAERKSGCQPENFLYEISVLRKQGIALFPYMDVYEIRRLRLNEVMNTRFGGRQIDLARALSLSQPYISLCLNAGTNNKKIGEKVARKIETALQLPKGWLDRWEGTGEMPYLSSEAIELALRFDSLTQEQRAALQAVLQALTPPGTDGKADPPPVHIKNHH
jgi:hypothetical protein